MTFSKKRTLAHWQTNSIYNILIAAAAAILTVYLILRAQKMIHFISGDMSTYYVPWLEQILRVGRWRALEASWANYNPPYVYNLSFFSILSGKVSPSSIVKIADLPYCLASALLFRSIALALGCSRTRAILAFWIALVIPEVVFNSFQWGQCDIQSTCFLLLFVRLLIARSPTWAMAALGVAFSFKLQMIFAGPCILALLLTRELPLASVLALPVAYLVMLIPARLAGRSFHDLLTIYSGQAELYPDLNMGASNLYFFLEPFTHNEHAIEARLATPALVFACIVIGVLVFYLVRFRPLLAGDRIIAALALSMTLAPFVLPKMHDRYFFYGDTLVVLLAMVRPRAALAALCSQAAAVMTYRSYFYKPDVYSMHHIPASTILYWTIDVFLNGISIALVARELASGQPTLQEISLETPVRAAVQ